MNARGLRRYVDDLLRGRRPKPFAADDFEVDFTGRGTEADLTPLGRSQMGLPPSEVATAL